MQDTGPIVLRAISFEFLQITTGCDSGISFEFLQIATNTKYVRINNNNFLLECIASTTHHSLIE